MIGGRGCNNRQNTLLPHYRMYATARDKASSPQDTRCLVWGRRITLFFTDDELIILKLTGTVRQ